MLRFDIGRATSAGLARKLAHFVSFAILCLCTCAAVAQTDPLTISNNYFVTGDYVIGGWVKGSPDLPGFATGTISIPDTYQASQGGIAATPIPAGADIVAAFLYWQTVESTATTHIGQTVWFNNRVITGTIRGNDNAPVSWSSGGCSGSSQGSKTIRTYRADVRPYLNLDSNGKVVGNGSYPVRLADSGSNGNTAPFSLGATLVVVYRVLSPTVPLSAVVIYDGSYAPSNSSQNTVQPMKGFYQANSTPIAKLTHIVGNGQPNKLESVFLNSQTALPALYTSAGFTPPFPGLYNGSWDNPTWTTQSGIVNVVSATDPSTTTTSVVPAGSNSGCVSWGAMIFSTTVQDTDNDGLLDIWEINDGYTDVGSNQFVSLPGADPNVKDIYVEVDYLHNLNGLAGSYLHSHLPKKSALDMVGDAFAAQNVNVHFDLGPGIYAGDPYVINGGTGGNGVSEGSIVCTDSGSSFCAFPNQPSVGWKGGLLFFKNAANLGNFQSGRKDSYHYLYFGHTLGSPRTYWSAAGKAQVLQSSGFATLNLIQVLNGVGTVTLLTPPGLLKPGDTVHSWDPGFGDPSLDRVTVEGALQNTALNGTYKFGTNATTPISTFNPITNLWTTIFTIQAPTVLNGDYDFFNEPQLGVTYGGPTSASGHSDIGGGDTAVTFGGWPADDVAGCHADPAAGPPYCDNQVGNVTAQAGTTMHELGHSFTLTHGGTFYDNAQNSPPSVPSYGLNCAPNFLSAMNYLFQIRGFPDGGIDYSGQTLPDFDETELSEASGIGSDVVTSQQAAHFTRWYAPANSLDIQLGNQATFHCNGTPVQRDANGNITEPPMVRVDGGSYSTNIDWNHDFIVPNGVYSQDANFNTLTGDTPLLAGFNDWTAFDLRQIGARLNVFGFSGGGITGAAGGGITGAAGGGITGAAGGGITGAAGGGITGAAGGGIEQDSDIANSTVDPPTGLTCTNCVIVSGTLVEPNKGGVPLMWTSPGFGQIRRYDVWRAVGSFPTVQSVAANFSKFSNIKTLNGTPPPPQYTDPKPKNNTTYTYFVTDTNVKGVKSSASKPLVVFVK